MKYPNYVIVVKQGRAIGKVWNVMSYCPECFKNTLEILHIEIGYVILRNQTWGTCSICKVETKQKHNHKSIDKLTQETDKK